MKKKILLGCIGVFVLGLTLSLSSAYAHGGSYGKGGGELKEMFFKKAHFILENKEVLGLAEDKVADIKNLKLETKKALIKQKAEIEVVSLDIKSMAHDYPMDVKAVNTLVDQKYELKKAMEKSVVGAISKLKETLTKDQYDKLRSLWESKKAEYHRN